MTDDELFEAIVAPLRDETPPGFARLLKVVGSPEPECPHCGDQTLFSCDAADNCDGECRITQCPECGQ